jgi:hypothetical protein
MASMNKRPDSTSNTIEQLVPPMGGCFITNRIAVDGLEIGFMYRERPDGPEDSGWRFFSGDESQEYLDNPDHTNIHEVNTAANFDRDIIPLLETPAPCAFEKMPGSHEYQQVESPGDAEDHSSDGELHPEFPVVEGRYEMTDEWTVDLPVKFNQRIEEEQLVFWRPGFTIWVNVWGLDGESPRERMESLKEMISSDATDLVEESAEGILRLAYRLEEEAADGRQPGFYGFAIGSSGHVQLAMYFDDEEDAELAAQIWRSLAGIPKG